MFVSFFGPGMFFYTLACGELTHFMSWFIFLPLKLVQFLFKIYSMKCFSQKFFDLERIYIKRSELDNHIILSLIDIIFEASAFAMIIYLGTEIDE